MWPSVRCTPVATALRPPGGTACGGKQACKEALQLFLARSLGQAFGFSQPQCDRLRVRDTKTMTKAFISCCRDGWDRIDAQRRAWSGNEMSSDSVRPTKIANNPSAKAATDVLPAVKAARSITGLLKKIGISNETIDKIHGATSDVLKQSDILTLPDRFNSAFASAGWIATGSMSAAVMRKAVALHEAGKGQEAEQEILAWFQKDAIALLAITRAERFQRKTSRRHQLHEALELTFEERYWAAVPLILIACDGFASDVLGTSPFEKDADLTVFDSVVGHPSSLQHLIELVTKGVRASSDAELTLPLRHGILHGRSLGYANRVVCMKAWLLMIALVDWAGDKTSEDERRRRQEAEAAVSLGDVLQTFRKLDDDKRAIEAFQRQETTGAFDGGLEEDSPEFAVVQFLTHWKARNYGKMAGHVVNLPKLSVNAIAGELRRDTEFAELTEFEVRSVRHVAVARAEAAVFLKGTTLTGEIEGEFPIVALKFTADGDAAMPSDAGKWCVQQRCIVDFSLGRSVDQNRN